MTYYVSSGTLNPTLSLTHLTVCGLMLCVAPSIYENMDIKKGILLQLFSGSQKDFDSSGRGKFRSDSRVTRNVTVCDFDFRDTKRCSLLSVTNVV